jgi:hypothetical protein
VTRHLFLAACLLASGEPAAAVDPQDVLAHCAARCHYRALDGEKNALGGEVPADARWGSYLTRG